MLTWPFWGISSYPYLCRVFHIALEGVIFVFIIQIVAQIRKQFIEEGFDAMLFRYEY